MLPFPDNPNSEKHSAGNAWSFSTLTSKFIWIDERNSTFTQVQVLKMCKDDKIVEEASNSENLLLKSFKLWLNFM